MRVVYFSRRYTPHDHRFLASLAETEHQVAFLQLEEWGPQLEARPVPPGIEAIDWWGGRRRLRAWDWPRAALEVRSVLRRYAPDVVHAGPVHSTASLAALSDRGGLLTMSWGSDLMLGAQRGLGRWLARWTLARSVAFVGDCQAVADKAAELGMPRRRMFLFPWGVDLNRFRPGASPALRARFGWGTDEIVLLSTRGWEPVYGLPELAQAFVALAQTEPRARLLLLGTGSLAPDLRQLFERGSVIDRVAFAGHVPEMNLPAYFQASDLYLSASHSDGSSISLLQAMACGLPAVVSDIAGNREWIESGQGGWWFKVKDQPALVEAMGRAIAAGPETWERMGVANRRIAEAKADWSENFPRLLAAYNFVQSQRVQLT